jgi:hypothetical protein
MNSKLRYEHFSNEEFAQALFEVYRSCPRPNMCFSEWDELTEGSRVDWIKVAVAATKILYEEPAVEFLLEKVCIPAMEASKKSDSSRQISIAFTKLEESLLWLREHLDKYDERRVKVESHARKVEKFFGVTEK